MCTGKCCILVVFQEVDQILEGTLSLHTICKQDVDPVFKVLIAGIRTELHDHLEGFRHLFVVFN